MSTVTAGPDILSDALFTVADVNGRAERMPLADLLARLLTSPEVVGFPRLAAEQRGHWWRFIVRCAAKSLRTCGWSVEHAGSQRADDLAAALRDTLRAAAGDPDGTRGVWALHQPHSSEPGFLQPPIPGKNSPIESGYSLRPISFLTSGIGEKEHERKSRVPQVLSEEEVVYAMLEYQLGSIYRLQHGYESQLTGSRDGAGSGTPFMGARVGGENETFRHDVEVFLSQWETIRVEHGLRGFIWALWTEQWSGSEQLASDKLDPAFVPLARLIRLPEAQGDFYRSVWFKPTWKKGAPRVRDLAGGGNFGDTLVPLVPDANRPEVHKIRGTLDGGYRYAEVANLLFGTDPKRPGTPSPSVKAARVALLDGRSDVRVAFEGTAFEQGKTVGFYHREVLLPPSSAGLLFDPEPARAVNEELLKQVKNVKSALNGAARILLSGAPKPRDGDIGKIALPADNFDATVDREYLDWLLGSVAREARDDGAWRGEWARRLAALALASFHGTRDAVPTVTARRYELEIRATGWLERRLRRIRADAGDSEAAFSSPEPQEAST